MCWEDSYFFCGECGASFDGKSSGGKVAGEDRLGLDPEVSKARKHLLEGEPVKFISTGLIESKMFGNDTKRNGIILATDRRVLIYCSKFFGGYELEEIPFSKMSSIEIGKGMLGHSATFIASSNRSRITRMNRGQPEQLINYVKNQIGSADGTPIGPAQPQPKKSGGDLVEQLQALTVLADRGFLTPEEFQQAKKKLLG